VSDNVEQSFETDIHTYIHTYIHNFTLLKNGHLEDTENERIILRETVGMFVIKLKDMWKCCIVF